MKRTLLWVACLLVLLGTRSAEGQATCPIAEFSGEMTVSTLVPSVALQWTVLEDASIREYRVSRYDCRRPRRCSVPVATMLPGSPSPAGEPKTYTMTDVPPAGAWTYRLHVVRTGTPSCIAELELLVPPPACDIVTLCAQVEETFLVTETSSEVRVSWSASAESGARGYRLVRFDPESPLSEQEIAVIAARGGCGHVTGRGLTERRAPGAWSYRLDVHDYAGAVACGVVAALDRWPAATSPTGAGADSGRRRAAPAPAPATAPSSPPPPRARRP